MYRLISIFIALMMNLSSLTAAEILGGICQTIPKGSIFKAPFTQVKYIKGIQKPLSFSGDILVWNGKGLLWDTKKPFSNTIYISKSGIYQVDKGEKKSLLQGHQDQVILESISKVLSGDFSALKDFRIKPLPPTPGQWTFLLVPLSHTGFKKVISRLVLEGDRRIKTITIYRVNGDKDIITLHSQTLLKSLPIELKSLFND